MTALEAIVFDFDGLILDTESPAYATAAEVWAEHGLDLPIERWQEIVGTADHPHWSEMLEADLGRPIDRDLLIPERQARHNAIILTQDPLPGVVDLVEAAHAAGLGLAVASSSPLAWVEGHLDRIGMVARFDALVCRDHVARTKPAPDLFLGACERLGVAPAAAVAIEDSRNGALAARAAGVACVAVPNRITAGQDLSAASLVAASLADVGLDDLRALVGEGPP